MIRVCASTNDVWFRSCFELVWSVAALGALAVFGGANLALQTVLNTQSRTYLFSPLCLSLVSYAGGLLWSLLALLAARQSPLISDPARTIGGCERAVSTA